VRRFTEKPDATTAQQFIDSGEYYWNAGIFVWRVQAILDEMARSAPALAEALQTVAGAWNTPQRAQVLAATWDRAPRVSIDYAVMEKAAQVAMLPVDIGWDDIGNWATLSRLLSQDQRDNLVHGGGQDRAAGHRRHLRLYLWEAAGGYGRGAGPGDRRHAYGAAGLPQGRGSSGQADRGTAGGRRVERVFVTWVKRTSRSRPTA